ncbi:MAG: hypothetical protein ACR2FY_01065 [Pirellulaceae bacterium]
MLSAFPVSRTPPRNPRRSRAPLRIYSPPAAVCPPQPTEETTTPRTGELQPIGQLLPQVLARYLSLNTEE